MTPLFRLLTILLLCVTTGCASRSYDLAIVNGRVINPETGLDAARNIGVVQGSIRTVSRRPVRATQTIDAKGMVVAPGFIDIHSHSPTVFGAQFQALDGVTTQLDLEAGAFPVTAYGEFFDQGAPLNFGASVGHLAVRMKVIEGSDQPYMFSRKGPFTPTRSLTEVATDAQIKEMRALLNKGVDQGGLGIGVLLDYISDAVRPEEMRMIFEVASERRVPVIVHLRRGMPGDPKGLDEVIALAEATGARLLVNHITHSAMQAVEDWLGKIDAANARGADIATETLTWPAGGTAIGAAVFGRDWQKVFNITYGDVQWTATGEWLTKESFEKYRRDQPAGRVNHHYVKDAWLKSALKWPRMMATSDATAAFNPQVLTNPNLSGTFSRLLGHYVRDQKVMPLREALAKSSLYQAQWLERHVPAFRRKGRLARGMDADIVIFDPATVAPGATYGKPYVSPSGIAHVIVGGTPVVKDGVLVPIALPGRRLLRQVPDLP